MATLDYGSTLPWLYYLLDNGSTYQVRLLTATLLVKLAREVPAASLLVHGQHELCAFAETAMATGDTAALGAGLEVLSTVQETLEHAATAANAAMAGGDCAAAGEGATAGEGGGKAMEMLVTTHRTRTLLRTLRADGSVGEAVRGQAKWLQHATRHGKHADKEDKEVKEVKEVKVDKEDSVTGWRHDSAASAPAAPPRACEEEGSTARDAGDAHLEMAGDAPLEMQSWEMHPWEMHSEEIHSDKVPRPEEELSENVRPEATPIKEGSHYCHLRVTTSPPSRVAQAAHRRLPTSPIAGAPQPHPDEVRPPKLLSTCTLHVHCMYTIHTLAGVEADQAEAQAARHSRRGRELTAQLSAPASLDGSLRNTWSCARIRVVSRVFTLSAPCNVAVPDTRVLAVSLQCVDSLSNGSGAPGRSNSGLPLHPSRWPALQALPCCIA